MTSSVYATRKRLRDLRKRQAFRNELRAELIRAVADGTHSPLCAVCDHIAELHANTAHAFVPREIYPGQLHSYVLGWLLSEAEASDAGDHPSFAKLR